MLVDLERDALVEVADRIVRDRREVHDRVEPVERAVGHGPNVGQDLSVEVPLGWRIHAGEAVGEEAGVEPDDARVRVRGAKLGHDARADISEIAGDQDRTWCAVARDHQALGPFIDGVESAHERARRQTTRPTVIVERARCADPFPQR